MFLSLTGPMEEAREQDFLQVPSFNTPMNVELNEDPWTPMRNKKRHSDAGTWQIFEQK